MKLTLAEFTVAICPFYFEVFMGIFNYHLLLGISTVNYILLDLVSAEPKQKAPPKKSPPKEEAKPVEEEVRKYSLLWLISNLNIFKSSQSCIIRLRFRSYMTVINVIVHLLHS